MSFTLHDMKNCPFCEGLLYYEFSKKDMQVKFIGNLIPKHKLRYGRILQCPDCENYWYEDYEPYHQYRALSKNYIQETLDWNSNIPKATIEQKSFLKQIKASPLVNSGANRTFIEFPVSCYYHDDWMDFCLVRFQKLPPFLEMFKHYMKFIKLDVIENIRKSDFALPFGIREVRSYIDLLGYRDVLLTSGPNQKFYFVGNVQNFFFFDGIKGSELKLESFFTSFEGKTIQIADVTLPVQYVIADWDEEVMKY